MLRVSFIGDDVCIVPERRVSVKSGHKNAPHRLMRGAALDRSSQLSISLCYSMMQENRHETYQTYTA